MDVCAANDQCMIFISDWFLENRPVHPFIKKPASSFGFSGSIAWVIF
jgi:hypothetical protein